MTFLPHHFAVITFYLVHYPLAGAYMGNTSGVHGVFSMDLVCSACPSLMTPAPQWTSSSPLWIGPPLISMLLSLVLRIPPVVWGTKQTVSISWGLSAFSSSSTSLCGPTPLFSPFWGFHLSPVSGTTSSHCPECVTPFSVHNTMAILLVGFYGWHQDIHSQFKGIS